MKRTGIVELKKALPRCKIEWDGGVIEPTANRCRDREINEWALCGHNPGPIIFSGRTNASNSASVT